MEIKRFVTAEHAGSRGITRVATAAVDIAALPDAIGALGTLAAGVAADGLVADLYVRWEDQPDADAMAVRLGQLLAGCPQPAGARRVTPTVARARGAGQHPPFPFPPDGAGCDPRRPSPGPPPRNAPPAPVRGARGGGLQNRREASGHPVKAPAWRGSLRTAHVTTNRAKAAFPPPVSSVVAALNPTPSALESSLPVATPPTRFASEVNTAA